MNEKTEQRKNIARGLAITAEVCGSQLSEGAIAVMVEELATYESEDVSEALRRVMREHTGRLSLAVIIERIDDPNAPMGADQAWAIAVEARIWDEQATLVIPTAIMQAWPHSLWNTGDKVAARMAFKSAYQQRLAECGDEIFVSLGYDPNGRRSAIEEAVRNGVITQARAIALLPELDAEERRATAIAEACRNGDLTQARAISESGITDPKSRAMIAELASSTKT